MKLWQQRQAHDTEVRALLKEQQCMDGQNQIRRWTAQAWAALKEAGHNSLDSDKCSCKERAEKLFGRLSD